MWKFDLCGKISIWQVWRYLLGTICFFRPKHFEWRCCASVVLCSSDQIWQKNIHLTKTADGIPPLSKTVLGIWGNCFECSNTHKVYFQNIFIKWFEYVIPSYFPQLFSSKWMFVQLFLILRTQRCWQNHHSWYFALKQHRFHNE